MLNIELAKESGVLTLILEGRIDTTTSPKLEAAINKNFEDVSKIVFDFKGVNYISSSGLRVLLVCQKQMRNIGTMILKDVQPEVLEVFEITGFTDILTIE